MPELYNLYEKYQDSTGISTDTRTVRPGNIFFALKGPTHDGNRYAAQALEKGAMLAVVDDEQYAVPGRTLLVKDALETLQELAIHHRKQLTIPIIGITGSNGKTTTKELIHNVLATKYRVFATQGNLNNHIGVPISVLSIGRETDIAIIEMGANHVGEIGFLCTIARPTHGLITNIGKAHIGLFGGIEGIIRGKTELYGHLRSTEGVVFVNQDQQILVEKSEGMSSRHLYPHPGAYYHCTLQSAQPTLRILTEEGQQVTTGLVGAYNFGNVAAALCIGKFFDVDAPKSAGAVAAYVPENNRSQVIRQKGVVLIMDAYNANPTSMAAAIDSLEGMDGDKKAVVLGDMYELGESTEEEHRNIGTLLTKKNIDRIYLCGEHMKHAHITCPQSLYFETKASLADHLRRDSLVGYTVLIKGSRGMALEALKDHIGH